jgi:hypothetical protein
MTVAPAPIATQWSLQPDDRQPFRARRHLRAHRCAHRPAVGDAEPDAHARADCARRAAGRQLAAVSSPNCHADAQPHVGDADGVADGHAVCRNGGAHLGTAVSLSAE